MKKLILTLAIIACTTIIYGQKKGYGGWSASDGTSGFYHGDTTYRTILVNAKLTIKSEKEIVKVNCNGFSVVQPDGSLKYYPCDSLYEEIWKDKTYGLYRTDTLYKNVLVKKGKPIYKSYTSSCGGNSNYYLYKGKRVYPIEIIKTPKVK